MMSAPRLRAFLHDVQRGTFTRTGYARFSFHHLARPTTKAERADLDAATRLGLIAWPSLTPGTAAELTDVARQLLKGAA
jgi:hypothetical protein